uniref:Uncharacterized protein n=1 Tax=Rhizophora mucronata TaxID=61149 RepID=A0A2P2PGU0_RHIMU
MRYDFSCNHLIITCICGLRFWICNYFCLSFIA